MSQHIWHAFYYDRAGAAAPCRSEVIEASSEEAASRVARSHLGSGERVSLETPPWTDRKNHVIFSEDGAKSSAYLFH